MALDDIKISRAIIDAYADKLRKSLDVEVAIVGGGPAGLTCGYYLAKEGVNVILIERKLAIGGGMWGGGMMFNEIVVQEEAKEILDEMDVRTREYEKGYYLSDSIEAISTITSQAVKAGVRILNCISAEDVMIRSGCIAGLVLNWSAVDIAKLHVDPLSIRATYTVDATGHAVEICRITERKVGAVLKTETGKIVGEGSMWADKGEEFIIKNTKEVYPGLYVCGMAANGVFGGPRMGPIFGGMLLSGRKLSKELIHKLKKANKK